MMSRHTAPLITIDTGPAEKYLQKIARRLLDRKAYGAAISMALNESIEASQTEANKAIREEFSAPLAEVRKTMRIWYATRDEWKAELRTRGKASLELIHYKAGQTAGGVSVKVLKSSKKSVIKAGGVMDILETQKRKRPRTWIAKGHVLAMTGKEKNPIRMLWGPSFLSRLSHEDIRRRVEQKGVAHFKRRLPYIAKKILAGKITT